MASGGGGVSIDISPALNKFLANAGDKSELKRRIREGAMRVGALGQAMMRRHIREGVDPEDSAFTDLIKGATNAGKDSKPVVDSGRLFKAITFELEENGGMVEAVVIGVMRASPAANIAQMIHDGGSFTVTRSQAVLFRVLAAHARGDSVILTSDRAKQIARRVKGFDLTPLTEGAIMVIPPRPFAKQALDTPEFRRMAQEIMEKALLRGVLGT